MNFTLWSRLTLLTALGVSGLGQAAIAANFNHREIAQNAVVAIAAPAGHSHQLLILEQLNSRRPCWSESGQAPVEVDPLLVDFDFTGICGRSTDSNGYSLRVNGQDLGLKYRLRLVKRANDLVLVASPFDRRSPNLEIGRTNGLPQTFGKIFLNPGWRMTKRTYKGQTLGHIYLTHDQDLTTLLAAPRTPSIPRPVPQPIPAQSDTLPPLAQLPPVPNTGPAPTLSTATTPNLPVVTVPPTSPTNQPALGTGDQAAALGFRYRVVVPATTPTAQARLKTIVPGAFRTNMNGQLMMQAGLFRTRTAATTLQKKLTQNNFPANVLPIDESTPTVGKKSGSSPAAEPSPNSNLSTGTAYYRVIVPNGSARNQFRLKRIVPEAFRTTVNGKRVLQAGLFIRQEDAQALRQRLTNNDFSAQVLPVQANQVPISQGKPQTPSPSYYRVIVADTTTTPQLKRLVPESFPTQVNGRTVLQAGLFAQQEKATELQNRLGQSNIQARIVPVTGPLPQPIRPQQGRPIVVLDPGHGGRDPGAVGIGGLSETDVVLPIAQRVARLLEQQGIQTILTRNQDFELDLAPRVAIAERADADVFVSIHANAATSNANGAETFYYRGHDRSLAQSIQSNVIRTTRLNDRGVKQANFHVLRNTSMPSALVEVGFLTGREDSARLRNSQFRSTMADAIANGILNYVKTLPTTIANR